MWNNYETNISYREIISGYYRHMKRMTKRRNYKKRNKTSKGGKNTKVHLIVRKSNILPPPNDENPKLFYELLFERPAFYPNNLFEYANIQRDAVDEALSWLHLEDVPERDEDGDEIQKIDTKVYEEKYQYGNTIDSETMEHYKDAIKSKVKNKTINGGNNEATLVVRRSNIYDDELVYNFFVRRIGIPSIFDFVGLQTSLVDEGLSYINRKNDRPFIKEQSTDKKTANEIYRQTVEFGKEIDKPTRKKMKDLEKEKKERKPNETESEKLEIPNFAPKHGKRISIPTTQKNN
jgi:hypothetical protein